MLSNYKSNLENLQKIKSKELHFCFSKHLNKKVLIEYFKNSFKEIMKKNKYSEYTSLFFYTNVYLSKTNEEYNSVKFSISYDHINIVELEFGIKDNLPILKNNKILFTHNDKINVKTSNAKILEMQEYINNNIIYIIKEKIFDFLSNEDNEDFIYYKNLIKQKDEQIQYLIKNIFLDKMDFTKFNTLIENTLNINLIDFEYKFYITEDYIKDNVFNFSIYLSPINILKYDSICVNVISYDLIKDIYKIKNNNLVKDYNILNRNIDICKNVNKINNFVLKVLKS